MGLKKQFLKSYLDFQVVDDTKGILKLYSKKISDIKDEDDIYLDKIIHLFKQVNGVDNITVLKDECILEIYYRPSTLNTEKINKYIDIILDLIVDNAKLIKNCNPNSADDLLVVLNAKFEHRVSKLNI